MVLKPLSKNIVTTELRGAELQTQCSALIDPPALVMFYWNQCTFTGGQLHIKNPNRMECNSTSSYSPLPIEVQRFH